MKQTAVEWLETQLKNILGNMFIDFTLQDDIEQAKQMEKQQIIDAANQIEFEDEDQFGISENITKGE